MFEKRLMIQSVEPGLIGEKVGLQVGDVLDEYGGSKLFNNECLGHAITANKSEATLKLFRDGNTIQLAVPSGRMGINVIEYDIDPETYHLECAADKIIVTTTSGIDGYRVTKVFDVISAECVEGMSVVADMFTSITDVIGGRSKTAQYGLRSARRKCIKELRAEAVRLGANAVIGTKLDFSEISGKGTSMLFLVASGTAVQLEKS